ncbi:MAG TPA: hypothetical protein VM690_08940 [Gaiellaceae bacterium]|nr:hypothetical protein [Gaiellaceae bacterium]
MLLAALVAATAVHFAGLTSATTCVPGPIGGDRLTSYHLRWRAATGATGVVYRIYQATAAGKENFAKPTYVTRSVGFTTPPLPASREFFFVVRAGTADRNQVERQGVNLCV